MIADFQTRKAAINYLQHFGFHKIVNSQVYSNGKYLAFILTYSYMYGDKTRIKSYIEVFPIEARLTPMEIKHKLEDEFYDSKESEIIAR